MIVPSYIIKKEVLIDSEYDLLCNIAGAWNSESSFAVRILDIESCIEATNELNTGEELTDCSGNVFVPDYDSDINFMTKLVNELNGCEYIIVEYDYEP